MRNKHNQSLRLILRTGDFFVMFQSQYTYVIAKEYRLMNGMALIGFVWNAISGDVVAMPLMTV